MDFAEIASHVDELLPVIAITGGLLIAAIAIISGTISKIVTSKARERSRREIAAYIAEGSISPDEGERLMRAQPKD